MVVNDMVDILAAQGDHYTDRMLFESSLYYHGAMLMNIGNLVKENGTINYFGLSFAGSGSGKDFSHKMVGKMFSFDDSDYNLAALKRLQANCVKSYDSKEYENLASGLPLSYKIGLDGTKEGLFRVARSQSESCYGSLNLNHPEFGDIINGSQDLLSLLKEAYDGEISAKIIKSENIAGVKNLVTNLMAFGSNAGMGIEEKNLFNKLVSSGMYRRSFIIDIKPKKTVRNTENVSTDELQTYLSDLKYRVESFNDNRLEHNKHNFETTIISVSDEAVLEIMNVNEYLINKSNENIYDDILAAEKGAVRMIENLAYIICFLEYRKEVESSDILAAFDFYKRCRTSTEGIFEIHRPFRIMKDLIEQGQGITMSEMVAASKEVPSSKNKFADEMLLVEEACYMEGSVLIKTGTKLERYNISEPPSNDNTKLVVGVCIDNKGNQSVDYAPMEVPLFGENNSIEALVKSIEPESFTLAHFESSKQAPNGHRRAESFISGQNVVGFDIDDSMALSEALELLKPYTYLVYTTKSHQKEKNGKVLDRFRIILPTKTTFYVDEEQHKDLYDNVANVLGIQIYDRQTRNVSRFWFTNPEAEVYTNIAENIDVTATLPETKAAKKFSENMNTLAENYDSRLVASINGFTRWFFTNTAKGNRDDHLFRLGAYMRDLGEDPAKFVEDFNAMLDDPMTDREVRKIIKSVLK